MQLHRSILTLVAAMAAASSVAANEVTVANDMLQVNSSFSADKVKMTVSGPDGLIYSRTLSSGDKAFSAADLKANKDGFYKFEFVEIKEVGQEQIRDDFNGRGLTNHKIVESNRVSGHFLIQNGAMVESNLKEEPSSSSLHQH